MTGARSGIGIAVAEKHSISLELGGRWTARSRFPTLWTLLEEMYGQRNYGPEELREARARFEALGDIKGLSNFLSEQNARDLRVGLGWTSWKKKAHFLSISRAFIGRGWYFRGKEYLSYWVLSLVSRLE